MRTVSLKRNYFYFKGTINEKRNIIGLIFLEKWTIIENKCRTTSPNLATQLIYQINSNLEHKKPEKKLRKVTSPAWYRSAGVLSIFKSLFVANRAYSGRFKVERFYIIAPKTLEITFLKMPPSGNFEPKT